MAADLPTLPSGQEWRRAEELEVGDEVPTAGGTMRIVDVAVKRRAVWFIGEARTAYGTVQKGFRPRRDTYIAVRSEEASTHGG